MTSRYALQDTVSSRSHEFMAYHLQPSTFNLSPKAYQLQPTTGRVGPGKLYYFLEFRFLESDRPSSSPVELPGTMLSMKFCIEWCRDQGLLSLGKSKFWGSGSWVSRVSPHIQILRSWASKVLRLSKFWGPGFPESHGKKDVQGPRSIKVPDLGLSEPRISNLLGNLGTSLNVTLVWALPSYVAARFRVVLIWPVNLWSGLSCCLYIIICGPYLAISACFSWLA